jgi:hypothetical protein
MMFVRPDGFSIEFPHSLGSPDWVDEKRQVKTPPAQLRLEVLKKDVLATGRKGSRIIRDLPVMVTPPRVAYDIDKRFVSRRLREAIDSGEWSATCTIDGAVVVADPAGLCTIFAEPDVTTLESARSVESEPGSLEAEAGLLFLKVFTKRLWIDSTPTVWEQHIRHLDAYAAAFAAMHCRFTMGHSDGEDPCALLVKRDHPWWDVITPCITGKDEVLKGAVFEDRRILVTLRQAIRAIEYTALPEWEYANPPMGVSVNGSPISLQARHVAVV